MTLAHLTSHTSGLPRLPGNLRITRATRPNPYAQYTVEDFLAALSACRPPSPTPTGGWASWGTSWLGPPTR